jgi:hypothetical protein
MEATLLDHISASSRSQLSSTKARPFPSLLLQADKKRDLFEVMIGSDVASC